VLTVVKNCLKKRGEAIMEANPLEAFNNWKEAYMFDRSDVVFAGKLAQLVDISIDVTEQVEVLCRPWRSSACFMQNLCWSTASKSTQNTSP